MPGIMYTVKDRISNPSNKRPTEILLSGLSCGKVIFPNRYNAQAPNTAIQMARNTSRSSQCACKTKSALERNLKAKANSRKPSETFTVLSQPPDFGSELSQPGNIANNINGKASAREKPSMPTTGATPPFEAATTSKSPTIMPVHENDTMAKASAINKMPTMPPRSACRSTLLAHEFGSTISNAPRNEIAKITSNTKKIILNQTLVDNALSASAPKMAVMMLPSKT